MRVHVVFHGVFAYVMNKTGIDVLVPFFAPHEYLLGGWMQFQPMPKGEITIQGLTGIEGSRPNPDFPSEQIPTVKGFAQSNLVNLFCVIHLPVYPSGIFTFRAHQNPEPVAVGAGPAAFPFAGLHGSNLSVRALGGPVVFVYEADSPDDVEIRFGNTSLDFSRVLDPTGQALNLHVFAEGVKDLPDRTSPDRIFQATVHFRDAWAQLSGVLAGLDLQLGQLRPFVLAQAAAIPNDTGLPGLPSVQLLDLDELVQSEANPGGDPALFGGADSDCRSIQIAVDNR
ncbi:MAG TPA: hypothetical protein VKU19_14025 [Bryobacteraceae bacterium]|nr:hypothetical protein [Bryobacteraceae bacterium]